MKTVLKVVLGLAIVLAVVYMLGPKSKIQSLEGDYPSVPTRIADIESFVRAKQDTIRGLKPGNEAKIVWADSLNKSKTPYSVVYIHGFGASEMEGSPVNRELAAHFGANLYLVRLPEHGIDREDAMKHLSAQKLVDEVREAYMIGKSLGDSVIVVGTSMGGALSLILASERPDMKALVIYSPAIEAGGGALDSFFRPWYKFIAENFGLKNGVNIVAREGEKAKYWSSQYHVNGYESLAVLLRSKMTVETFQNIHVPVFLAYYYKNEQEQDFVVSVPKMLEMYDQLGTEESQKRKMAFPNTGDHVIASSITSHDWEGVLRESIQFLERVAKVPVPFEETSEFKEAA
ncbi:alpha/beta hydrolase [Shivajiella indica]|uniref:Alpha/beta hydrolase n=1 Tax=Shivajiella indica TaxID=872115 RepID=A0ABW5B8T0_9BACT